MFACCCFSHNGMLTAAGYAAVAQRRVDFPEGVDMFADMCYLDGSVSVSALVEPPEPIFDFVTIGEQFQRIHNGS